MYSCITLFSHFFFFSFLQKFDFYFSCLYLYWNAFNLQLNANVIWLVQRDFSICLLFFVPAFIEKLFFLFLVYFSSFSSDIFSHFCFENNFILLHRYKYINIILDLVKMKRFTFIVFVLLNYLNHSCSFLGVLRVGITTF